MTLAQRISSRFFLLTIGLLILYALSALLAGSYILSADPAPVLALSFQHINGLANLLQRLALWTGLLGGGVYLAAQESQSADRWLALGWRLWVVVIVLQMLAGLLGLLEGRVLLEAPPILALIMASAVLFITAIVSQTAIRNVIVQVWAAGMILAAAGTLLALMPVADYLAERAWRALALGLIIHIGMPVAGMALAFWLIHRVSDLTPAWVERGIYVVGGLTALAGGLTALGPLAALTNNAVLGTLLVIGACLVPLCWLITAAHVYRALSARNATYTLAAHWLALGLLLFLPGGLLGALQIIPDIARWSLGTRLTDLQTTLMALAGVAISLGVINQASAELHGRNRRLTGLAPFWLVSFGAIIGALALGAAGLVQLYLERALGVGYLDTQTGIIPLYAGWFGAWLIMTAGLLWYALTYWLRRPRPVSPG